MKRLSRKLIVMLLLLASLTPVVYISAAAGNIAYGAATVDATSLNVRSGPDTTYAIIYTIQHNEKIVILEKLSNSWFHIVYRGFDGYVATEFLTNIVTAENFDAVGKLTGDNVYMRSTPATSGASLATCDIGQVVTIIGINNGWYKVKYNGKTGYIRSDFITIIDDGSDTGAASTVSGSAPAPVPTTVDQQNISQRDQLVNYALQYVGYSYVYGGSSPSSGFDCSGFSYYVFHHFGFDVTRTASSQYAQDGTKISKAELQPGDLVFFSANGGYSITHVGIYIGNHQFVHASTPKIGVVVSSLDSSYYLNVWYGAKRVLA